MDITEQDRIAAREEVSKGRMSEKTATRLAAINESERREREAQKEFAERFETWGTRIDTLVSVLARCSTDQSNLERRALKLRRCLAMGWKVRSVSDVLFFSHLTDDEAEMSDDRFYDVMTAKWPKALKPQAKGPSNRQKVRSKPLLKSMVWADTQLTRTANPHGCLSVAR